MVCLGGFGQFGGLVGAQRPDRLGRSTHDQAPGWNHRVLCDQRPGGHQAARSDDAAVEQDGAHADETAVFHRAAVQDRGMAYGHVPADRNRESGVAVQDRGVLDVGAPADADRTFVAPQHGVVPDAGPVLQRHAAHKGGAVRRPGGGMQDGGVSLEILDHSGRFLSGWIRQV